MALLSFPSNCRRLWHRATSLKKGVAAALGLCLAIALQSPANASVIWNFAYSATLNVPFNPIYPTNPNQPINASGQLITTDLGGNVYSVIDIIGSYNGMAMSLIPAGQYAGNDNLLYPAKPFYLDGLGLSFMAGGHPINFYLGVKPAYNVAFDDAQWEISNNGSFTISAAQTAVPEPSSILLFGAGLLGAGLLGRRKRKAA
jgi:hypothetical protein